MMMISNASNNTTVHPDIAEHSCMDEDPVCESSIPTIVLSPFEAIFSIDPVTCQKEHGGSCCAKSVAKNCKHLSVSAVPIGDDNNTTLHVASVKRKRPALLSATVFKENLSSLLGMGINKSKGSLCISSLNPRGLLGQSPFRVGDKIISINNTSCEHMSKVGAADLLKQTVGRLTVVVENFGGDSTLVESMVVKPTPSSKVGLGVVSNGHSHVCVSSVNPAGLFSDSLLSRKDRVLCINQVPCEYGPALDAAGLIVNATHTVTVVAQRKPQTAVVVAIAA